MSDDIKTHIKGEVTFVHYTKGNLWYVTESGYHFPVPISDTHEGVFLPKDRAMLFMRYIRKQMQEDGPSTLPT